jgi:hypothetical protein
VSLEAIIGITHDELLHDLAWFMLGNHILTSRQVTLRMAELACKRVPTVILDWVIDEGEEKLRHLTKRAGTIGLSNTDGDRPTSPAWEWHWYREHHRPKHELLRQWCGHRAITFHERLLATEAEVQRLDVVIARLIDEFKVVEPTDVNFAQRVEDEIENGTDHARQHSPGRRPTPRLLGDPCPLRKDAKTIEMRIPVPTNLELLLAGKRLRRVRSFFAWI